MKKVHIPLWLVALMALGSVMGIFGILTWTTTPPATLMSIGTGGLTGVYYPAGGAICRLVNQNRADHGFRCMVGSSGGSIENIQQVLSGEETFGLVQSDVHWQAVHGLAPFDSPQGQLRSLFALHPETAVLVVRNDSGIEEAHQVRGHRINLGNQGSGQRHTSDVVLGLLGLGVNDLALAGSLHSSDQGEALQANKIDGFFYMVGHPNSGLKDVFYTTNVRLLPLQGPLVDQLVASTPYYVHAATPAGHYQGIDEPVPTFATKATFVTSSKVDDTMVYEVVRAVFSQLEQFRSLHPALENLNPQRMLEGLSAPLHPGAERYYREAGLLSPF